MKKEKPVQEKTRQTMLEEIRTRVFEQYAEVQGIHTQESELKATIEALHEVTQLPVQDIEKIATDVIQTYQGPQTAAQVLPEKFSPPVLPEELTFPDLRERVKRKRREFIPHGIAYVCVQIPLIYLNLISTSFPWVMFPLLGWGIGLAAHYFEAVHWPAKDLREKIQALKSQIHQILDENVPAYRTSAQDKIFNGTYRLVAAESSQEMMSAYLKSVDPRMADHEIRQATTQLCSIRDKYL